MRLLLLFVVLLTNKVVHGTPPLVPPPEQKCPTNEKWVDCELGYCVPKTCDSVGFPIACPGIAGPCPGACVCIDNYARNSKGICIPMEKCPSCGGDFNATTGCGNHCGNTCEYHNSTDKECKEICQYGGCDCRKGYVYDASIGKCVLHKDCVTDPQGKKDGIKRCPKNEKWVDCEANVCIPKKCSDLGYPIDCTKTNESCAGGCICNASYLRNQKGICIPVEKCPSCRGDCNATIGCDNYCGHSCSDYQDKDKNCGVGCVYNGCKCRDGYVYHERLKECVLPKDCQCDDPNAERVSCATHCPPTCAVPIPNSCPYAACTPDGCNCKHGYILNEPDGKCIPINDCPAGLGCNGDMNATVTECPHVVPPTCDLPEPPPIPKICDPVGCNCNPGYIKSESGGDCIRHQECEEDKPCGKNATFAYCKVDCPNDYCPVDDSRGIIACDPPVPCPPGCICNLNYRRNNRHEQRCILASECPPVECTRKNEVWNSCPSMCLAENCRDVDNQPSTCNALLLNCQPQCICKKGYFRDIEDNCIPADECPKN